MIYRRDGSSDFPLFVIALMFLIVSWKWLLLIGVAVGLAALFGFMQRERQVEKSYGQQALDSIRAAHYTVGNDPYCVGCGDFFPCDPIQYVHEMESK